MADTNYKYDSKYKFNEEWFDKFIPLWDQVFTKFSGKINNVLEIGCYEGRATIYLCDNFLNKGTNYTVVDTFGGSEKEEGMAKTMERLKVNKNIIEENFRHNISYHNDINFTIHKGMSQNILPELYLENEEKFDFIYIDASHRADDTFVDAYYAHKMLKKEGILIFDDFGWKDPTQPELIASPEYGIRSFITMYENLYTPVHVGYQVVLKKNIHKTFKV